MYYILRESTIFVYFLKLITFDVVQFVTHIGLCPIITEFNNFFCLLTVSSNGPKINVNFTNHIVHTKLKLIIDVKFKFYILHSHVVPAINKRSFPIMDRIFDTISNFSSAFKYGPSPFDPPIQYPENHSDY